MSLIVMVALGLIPWAIAVQRLLQGRNRDLDPAGSERPVADLSGTSAEALKQGDLLADDTLFGAIVARGPGTDSHAPATGTDTAALPGHAAAAAEETEMIAAVPSVSTVPQTAGGGRSVPDLAIIDGFVPGDDMLELTLDEAEVAAAERAGVRLDIRVERSSSGRGSLITVGGTPLAFVRGTLPVSPRDIVLRVDRLEEVRPN